MLMRIFSLVAVFLAAATAPAFTPQNSETASKNAVQVEMQNVMYHYTEPTAAHIVRLQGELIPTKKDGIPFFDDRMSFVLAIRTAEISINVTALANVLNQYVLSASDAPLKQISLSIENKLLKIKGRLHSKGDIPFETDGTISATPQGEIRIHAEKIKAAHLPVKGLMDLFDLSIAKVIQGNQVKGLRAEQNDLLLDPAQLLPPPKIQGKITAVELRGNEIVQIFGDAALTAPKRTGNYMAYRGNQLRFNKLTMNDTDMIIIDMDPRDPFDFFLDRYIQQLAAGYSKTTMDYGLRVYMRDYNKLQHSANRAPAAK
ncbi:MAG: hypothetical protein QOD84_3198 [Acidobacteriaceae bacterium]|jgi:hypothetical protein